MQPSYRREEKKQAGSGWEVVSDLWSGFNKETGKRF
jgi:hypothetical protein